MDTTTRRICALLESPDAMRRCAAAIALAELAPKDAAVVKALGGALAAAEPRLAGYLLEALDAIGSPAAVPYVLPMLDAPELDTKLRAAAIVARGGAAVVGEIERRIDKATSAQKLVLIDVLARVHTREALRVILHLLDDPDLEVAKQCCDAVRRHIADVRVKDRGPFHKQVLAAIEPGPAQTHERVAASCLLLLGYLGRPECVPVLLRHATPERVLYLRRHALLGLKHVALAGAAAVSVSRELQRYLGDGDDGFVRLVLETLDHVPESGAAAVPWTKLLASANPTVRAHAARKTAAADNPAANRRLVALLAHEDTVVREIAAGALSAHPGATPLLLEALRAEADPEAAWRLAKILKPHGAAVDPKARKRFIEMAADDLQAGRPRHQALLYFLRNMDPNAADEVLRDAGLAHQQAKRWAPAVECLRRLINTEFFDDEIRYALSVSNLKLSPKDLASEARAEDHAVRGFQGLVHNPGFGLLARLTKDKSLDAAELYYLGFHFSEAIGEDSAFGRELLAHVAKKWPRTDAGRAARNKLKSTRP